MFTRCPACETTFRLGADDLRRAQGRVRCGECATVFNALQYLAEDPETAARPNNWLPEPANDATSPDDNVNFFGAAAEDEEPDLEISLEDTAEQDTEELDTSIFVTDPDDDGLYYRTGTFNIVATREEGLPTDRSDESNDDFDDFSTLLDAFEDISAEPDSTERWSKALQQHTQAESGLDLIIPARSDMPGMQELTEAALEPEPDSDMTLNQPVLQTEPDDNPAAFEEDFDDTIWERIPGVGAHGDAVGRPIGAAQPAQLQSSLAEDTQPLEPRIADTDIADDDDALEFNAPEETWSNIFVSGPAAANSQDEDDEDYPRLYADKASEDGDETADENDDMAQLERIFNPERIAAALQERTVGRADFVSEALDSAAFPADRDDAAPDLEDPERQEAMAVWLTDEEPDDALEADEPPDEGYDVQHIILADESEAATARADEKLRPAANIESTPPRWRAEAERPPARNGLWLTGGLLLLAALTIQLLHYNRDSLAANPVWGSAIMNAYALLDMEVFPAWAIDSYEIRSAEAVTGESGTDIMDIRAQIAVVGNTATGFPHLRVVLNDRWSKPVAEKTFGPADYAALPASPGDQLLQPGQTIEAHVGIVDPGAGAQGFELELCLPRRHTGMECTGQPFK